MRRRRFGGRRRTFGGRSRPSPVTLLFAVAAIAVLGYVTWRLLWPLLFR